MNKFNLIIQGSSHRGEFVHCKMCRKQFVWLKAREVEEGVFEAVCAKCRRTIM